MFIRIATPMAIVKDAMTNLESESETGAKKFLEREATPFNRVETTMALDGRATLASSAHFNGSTHCDTYSKCTF